MDLVEFLNACLAEDTRMAFAARDPWFGYEPDQHVERVREADALYIARHSPNRVLAEVDAKREIVKLHGPAEFEYSDVDVCLTCDSGGPIPYPCPTLRLLALPYADHPDYREEWRP